MITPDYGAFTFPMLVLPFGSTQENQAEAY